MIGCRKNENSERYIYNESGLEINNITPNSIHIQYKVKTIGLKETGLLFSEDSSVLISHDPTLVKLSSVFVQKDSSYSCNITNLVPYSKYWIQIYFKNASNEITFSKLYSITSAGFNIRWRDNFSKLVFKGETIDFYGEKIDTIRKNYKILYASISCPLLEIVPNGNQLFGYVISIPLSVPFGKHSFALYYKDKIIFEDILENLKGTFCEVVKNSKIAGFSNSFCYNNEIYFYYGPGDFGYFWKWNPKINKFTQLSAPNLIPDLPQWEQGSEINGKIYFPPFSCNTAYYTALCAKSENVEKYIYSYDPSLGKWEKNALVHNDTIPLYAGLYASFVYENKLYCFVLHSVDGNKTNILLKVFDPIDFSWRTVLNSVPFPQAWGCKAAVVNDKIYVLSSLVSYNNNATTYFKNELYSLDLETKTFVKKSIWDDPDVGSINPYFFEYKKHLYFYGGRHGQGYFTAPENRAHEYAPENDKWYPLSSYYIPSYTSASLGGFLQIVENKIYFGFGFSNFGGNSNGWGETIYEYILE